MANPQVTKPVGSSSEASIQQEINTLGSQVKELQVFLSDSGTIISKGPLAAETEIESGYASRMVAEHGVSPRRPGDCGVTQGPSTSLRFPETRRRLSFLEDQGRRRSNSPLLEGISEVRRASEVPSMTNVRRSDPRVFRERPALLPMTFDGQTAWQDFKVHFEMVADLNNWEDVQKATYLAVSLRGAAQEVLGNLPQIQRQNYDLLVQALTQRFAPSNQTELHKVQLKARSRRRDESLTELGQSIRRLTGLAYPDAHQELVEILAKDHFIDALQESEMRLRVQQARPKTLNEAVHAAVELETFQRAELQRQGGRRFTRAVTEPKAKSDLQSQVYELAKAIENLTKMMNDRQGNKKYTPRYPFRNSEVTCFNCSEKGHYRKDCPKLIFQNSGN